MDSPNTPDVASSAPEEAATAAPPAGPNIREVKQKTLELLTELYKTETGDVKKMAMSLLQTLYTVEDQDQISEMEVKIKKLLKMVNDQKNEDMGQFEIDDQEEDGPSPEVVSARAASELPKTVSNETDASPVAEDNSSANKDDSNPDGKNQADLVQEAMVQKDGGRRWKWPNLEAIEKIQKRDFTQSKEKIIRGWRESTTKIESKIENIDFRAPRERIINRWRESTSKLQVLARRRNMGDPETNASKEDDDNKTSTKKENHNEDDDSSSEHSATTEASSNPPSPTTHTMEADDLLNVLRNFVKEGDPNSRASLEQALSNKRQTARDRWSATRAKWRWPVKAQA
eukprot:scaffold2053_cov112-Cylindrotheca_fusiformis.AAC.15